MQKTESYLPSLFSRLTEDENLSTRALSDLSFLKKEILKNIEMLLNSRSHPRFEDLAEDRELYFSVLGYGINDFCGLSHGEQTLLMLLDNIKAQIIFFEPRLDPSSVQVKLVKSPEPVSCSINVEITGRITVKPFFENIDCLFSLDLESGIPSTR